MRLFEVKRVLAWSVLALSATGCGAHASKAAPQLTAPTEARVAPEVIAEDAFASAVHDLLLDRASGGSRSASVVARQLRIAGEQLGSGAADRGLSSLKGAMLLFAVGGLDEGALQGSDDVLAAAYKVVAPQGDEGAAFAVLKMRAAILPEGSPARAEVLEQLAALQGWLRETKTGSPLENAGHEQRVAVARALLEPTVEAGREAREATIAWIEQAVAFSEESRHGLGRPRREDTVEAFRAFRSGAKALIALSLRNGDASTALQDLERSSARRMVSEGLYERLEQAASGGDARAFSALLAALLKDGPADDDRDNPELALDPDLERAAAFGTAVEVLRRDPAAMDAAMPVAIILAQLGMPEVMPLVLAEPVAKRPEPLFVSASLGILARAIVTEDEATEPARARRIFQSATPILEVASREELRGKLQPSAANLRIQMALIEMKAAKLAAARPLLSSAAEEEQIPEVWMMVSAIDRQAGELRGALDSLDRASVTVRGKNQPVVEAEVHFARYELLRDSGEEEAAKKELSSSLEKALSARERSRGPKSRAERLLARILDAYGDHEGTARAIERAFEAAGGDPNETASIAIDASARALARNDVKSARQALSRAIDARLEDDDLVYVALWLSLAEKATRSKADGSASRVLAGVESESWTGKLAAWGLGKLGDRELLDAAKTPAQEAEARFYAAMAQRIGGDPQGSETSLRELADGPNIDLVEVRIAREIVKPKLPLPGGLPKGAKIP